jgi:hypothetical protein
MHALLCDHTHLLPSHGEHAVEECLKFAMNEVLGPQAKEVNRKMDQARTVSVWAELPSLEAKMLWLRENLPETAGRILSTARRRHAEFATSS